MFPTVIMQNPQPGQPVQDLLNFGGPAVAGFYNAITSLGVQIPLMTSPAGVFDMVLGSPIKVPLYQLPTVVLDQSFSQDFPVWPVPPISIHLEVDLQFQAGATIAFNTAPLIEAAATGQPVNPLDGFEISDGLVDGDGQPATVHVGIHATAGPAIGIPDIATLSVNGQLNGDIWLRLANTDGDGGVSGSTLANENAIFLTSGTIDGGINADLELGSQEFANTVSQWLGPIGQAVSSWVYKDYTLFQSPMVELANFNTDADDDGYGRVLGVNISSVAAASEARADGLALGHRCPSTAATRPARSATRRPRTSTPSPVRW